MSGGQRIAMLAAAAIVAALALVLLGGDDEDGDGGREAGTTAPAETAPATEPGSADEEPATEGEPATEEKPEPERPTVHRIRVRGGEPVGGLQEIAVKSGETVRIVVQSDVADHVHVHGYDLFEDVPAGGSARFRFKAELEGAFEIELEDRHVQLAELRVEP